MQKRTGQAKELGSNSSSSSGSWGFGPSPRRAALGLHSTPGVRNEAGGRSFPCPCQHAWPPRPRQGCSRGALERADGWWSFLGRFCSDAGRRATFVSCPCDSLTRPPVQIEVASVGILPPVMGALVALRLRRCSDGVQPRAGVRSARFQSARKGGRVKVPGGSAVLVAGATRWGRAVVGILTTACSRRRADGAGNFESFPSPAAAEGRR